MTWYLPVFPSDHSTACSIDQFLSNYFRPNVSMKAVADFQSTERQVPIFVQSLDPRICGGVEWRTNESFLFEDVGI